MSMQIFTRTLAGKTLTHNVDPNDTVASLKQKLFDREGIPAN